MSVSQGQWNGITIGGGELEIKIQHFVCFSGNFHDKCFKMWLFQHYIWKKRGGYSPRSPPGPPFLFSVLSSCVVEGSFILPLVRHLLKFRSKLLKKNKPLPSGLQYRINSLIRDSQRQVVKMQSNKYCKGSRE